MSALVGFLESDAAYIATDTLVRYLFQEGDTYIKPSHFAPKSFHLPQFKSIFGATGHHEVGLTFYEFLTQQGIGLDLNSVINIDPELFREELEIKHKMVLHGTICLYGYGINSNELKGYWLPVNKENEPMIWRPLGRSDQGAMAMIPRVNDWHERIPANEDRLAEDLLSELVLLQKQDDELKPVEQRAGIGGEIIVTKISRNDEGKLIMSSLVVRAFSDYYDHCAMIILARKQKLGASE